MPKQKVYNTKAIYFTNKLKREMAELLNFPCTLVEAPMGYGQDNSRQGMFKIRRCAYAVAQSL